MCKIKKDKSTYEHCNEELFTGRKHRLSTVVSRIAGICIWVVLISVCAINIERISVDGIVDVIPQNSWISVLVLLCMFAVKSVSVVVYAGILYAASGILFSLPIAITINVIGTVIMVSIPYFIGKKAGMPLLECLINKRPRLALIRDFQSENCFFVSFLVRLVGCLPGDLVCMCFGAGVSNYWRYLAGSILGSVPAIVAFAVMGMSVNDVTSPAFLISLIAEFSLMLVSTVLAIVYNSRKKRTSNVAKK